MIYPELLPVGPDLVIEQQNLDSPLLLRRDVMLLSTSPVDCCDKSAATCPTSCYLLDSGNALVLYRFNMNYGYDSSVYRDCAGQ